MKQGAFCIDASVLITAHQQYYAFDLFPRFWKSLARWGKQGKIVSCAAVFNELSGYADALSTWAKANAALFPQPDLNVGARYEEVVKWVNTRYEPQHAQVFLAGADPWLVAQAAVYGQTIVTLEVARQEHTDPRTGLVPGRVKLPNVCAQFKVKVVDTFEMLRRLGFKC